MKFDKYFSTTLPYANSVPHIGHALEFIQADCLVKYFRYCEHEKIFFNIGVDENGLKVYTKAKELGLDTKQYLDKLCLKWTEFCRLFEIEADSFYRTTNKAHHIMVQKFWNECLDRGDLYKKAYSGKYCVGCESFKSDSDLVDNKCPDHGTEPILTEEENWFFKVSKHKGLLRSWLKSNEEFLTPQSKITELENIILNSEDISVSRLKKNVPWGIEVPNDKDHVIYVWFEALLNYVFAVQNFNDQKFIQLCGPDNLRFQGSLLQSILLSANYKNTTKLLVHGTILDSEGRKMSKTLGNVIDPIDQLNKYGLDAVRYYTLAGLNTYGNGCWSEKDLVDLYNSHLADNFGNLLTRTLHLIDTKNVEIKLDNLNLPEDVKFKYVNSANHSEHLFKIFEISEAIKQINNILSLANKYINDSKPWSEGSDYVTILTNVYYMLSIVTEKYKPILSNETYLTIKEALKNKKKVIIFKKK